MTEKRLTWWLLVLSQGMLTLGMGMIVFSGIMSQDGLNRWGILSLACSSVGFVTNLIALRQWRVNKNAAMGDQRERANR